MELIGDSIGKQTCTIGRRKIRQLSHFQNKATHLASKPLKKLFEIFLVNF